MSNKLLFLVLSVIFVGCNSPRNNRVSGGEISTEAATEIQMFSATGLRLNVMWITGPFGTNTKTSEMMVIVTDSKGVRASIKGELGFYAWMPSMGHPAGDAGFFEEVETGVYLNSGIRFNMGGEWELSLQDLDEDYNVKDEVKWLEFL